MRSPVLIAASLAVLYAVISFGLPIWVRLKGHVGTGGPILALSVRPHLFPWFIPFPTFSGAAGGDGRKPASTSNQPAAEPAVEPREPLVRRIRHGIAVAKSFLGVAGDVIDRVSRSARIDKLWVRGTLGVGDAFQTALLLGSINSLSAIALRLMRSKGIPFRSPPWIRFAPRYDCLAFESDFEVISGMSPLDGLRLALYLGRIKKRGILASRYLRTG